MISRSLNLRLKSARLRYTLYILTLTFGDDKLFHGLFGRSSGPEWSVFSHKRANLNRALWRHACAISVRLFRLFGSFDWWLMATFSARQSSQLLCPGLYGSTILTISHVIGGFGFWPFSHIYADRAVAFFWLLFLKLPLWALYLFLKLLVEPI